MPNNNSAKKRLRQSVRQNVRNQKTKKTLKQSIRTVTENNGAAGSEEISQAYSNIDKALKKGIMHKNKAGRLKSMLARTAKTQ